MVEQAQHVVFFQGFVVVLLIHVQDTIFAIITWEFEAFLSTSQGRESQRGKQQDPGGLHGQY